MVTLGSKKGLVSEEHSPCSYVPLSSARSWRGLEEVIYVLLLISDSHTKCACVPAVHPHPWAPGSCAALHQGASVSFAVTLLTGVIARRKSKRTFFPCDKQKSSSCCSWRRTETCSLKTGSWTWDNVLFCCSISFFAQVTFWFCSLHVTNEHVVKGLSPIPTLLGQWLYRGISLKTHISEILTAKCQMYCKLHHLIVKVRVSCDGQTFSGHPTQSLFSV